MFRRSRDTAPPEVFLVHPGGPFFTRKDAGNWTISKGLPDPDEPHEGDGLLVVARREFNEETGLVAEAPFLPLGSVKQRGGKRVHAWAFVGDTPADFVLVSNLIEIPWPPRSGQTLTIPEVDASRFFDLTEARTRINAAQVAFLDRLVATLHSA